jgi:outer membrane protein OmpA-like peptidoglycan-associated protein
MKKYTIFVLLVIFALISVKSQEIDTTNPYLYLGIYGGINDNIHKADFSELPGVPNCCPSFETGTGIGYNIGGLLRVPVDLNQSVSIRIGYMTLNGLLKEDEMIGNTEIRNTQPPYETSDIVKAYSEHSVNGYFGLLTFEPTYNWQFWDNFRISAGLLFGYLGSATFSQKEQLISPNNVVFKDTETRIRNQFDNVTLQDKNSFQFYGKVSFAYAFKFGKNMNLAPEIGYMLPFTNVYSSKWKVTPINLTLALEYPLTHSMTKDTIQRTEFIRDTTTLQRFGIDKEQINLLSKTSKVELTEEQNEYIAKTIITENYQRIIPKKANLQGDLKIVGVDNNGNLQENPTLVIEEIEVSESFPLLPYVFFKENSSDLSQTAMILKSNADNKEFVYKELPWETLDIYANLLNIIKYRLEKDKNATIKITGTNNNLNLEANNLELSKARAESLKNYLIENLKIPANRIDVAYRNLPAQPSNPTIADGIQENQRDEISSNSFSVLAPVELSQIEKVANPPVVEITPNIKSDVPFKNGEISISQNGKVIRKFAVHNSNEVAKWVVAEEPIPQLETPIEIKFQGKDTLGNEIDLSKNINIAQKTIKKKREEIKNDTIFQRYSLIVFDFDKSELTANHKIILDDIKAKIRPNSIVSIYGYADRTGTSQYNKDLASRRIDEVVKYLKIKPENIRKYPIGSDELLYNNDTPQGRSYSRTVKIIVATPVK